jgi:uncharacterized protein (TIGR03083 family)
LNQAGQPDIVGTMGDDDVRLRTVANRRVIARLFARLDDEQLDRSSLCVGWTCRDVLGHLVMALDLSVPRLLLEVVRDRGRSGVTFDRLAHAYAARPVRDLVRQLDEDSGVNVTRPGVGALSPFADSCIHLRDVAIPLGIATTAPTRDWVRVLEFLTTTRARVAGFLPRGRLDGLQLHASDEPWSNGTGAPVFGTSEALALSLTGRPELLDELVGPGVQTLRRRVLDPRP